MNYIRVCKGVNDKGTLLPRSTDVYRNVDLNHDYYTSAFLYNEEQYQTFKQTGTVAGITDTVTDKLYWDFDSAGDLTQAKADAEALCQRLEKDAKFSPENIALFFSGKKGFQVEVTIKDAAFTPAEVKNICLNLGDGLHTLDRQIYNSNRILRLPLSKHQDTGLYKIPLNYSALSEASIEEIREEAKNTMAPSDFVSIFKTAGKNTLIDTLKAKTPKLPEVKAIKVAYDISEVDWSSKPKFLTPEKYLLSLGFFESGERSHALMILGSTFKSLGFNETQTYHFLKSAAEQQGERTGEDKFPKSEIYKNIIAQIYSPTWKGGVYSVANDELLQRLSTLIPASAKIEDEADVHDIEETAKLFVSYAKDIDKNTLKFGIPCLDNNLYVQVGRRDGIIGPPGSGKCHGKGTKIMMYDGTTKNVEDVKVGDVLMGDDSTPRLVLSTCSGLETLYRVIQNNGDDYVVNESHILSLKGSSTTQKQFAYGKVEDISVTDYLNKNDNYKKRMKGYKVAVEFAEKNLPIDPYIFGLWIGDGTTKKSQFTISDKDKVLIEKIKEFAKKTGHLVNVVRDTETACVTVNLIGEVTRENPFLKFIQNEKLVEGKKIPHQYLTSSREQRLRLLAGILDTDGYYCKVKNNFELSTSSKELSENYAYLCRSLGFRVTVTKENKKYKSYTKGKLYEGVAESYRLYIVADNLNEIPTVVERKKAKYQEKQRYQDLTEIVLDNIGEGEYFGFEINGNHRYLLGDFTVTHNTSLGVTVHNNTSKLNIPSMFFSFDMSKFDVFQKLIQRHTKMDRDKLYDIYRQNNKDEQHRIAKLVADEYKNVRFVFKTGQSIEEMKQTIIHTEKKLGVNFRLIVVDYLELVQSKYSDPTQSSAEVIQGLREIAINMNIAVLVFLQPNKMSSTIDEPLLSYNSAKGSSAIAQACTAILTIHRPGYSSRTPETDKFFSIDCVKNRSGRLFSADLHWDGLTGNIRELEDIERMELKELRDAKKAAKDGGDIDLF